MIDDLTARRHPRGADARCWALVDDEHSSSSDPQGHRACMAL